MSVESYDVKYKIVLVGDKCVGKSSLLSGFCEELFLESYKQTIGVDFNTKIIGIATDSQKDKKKIKLQIWDTAGNVNFKAPVSSIYKSSDALIIVLGQKDWEKETEESNKIIKKYINESEESGVSDIPITIVLNQSDINEEKAIGTAEELRNLYENYDIYVTSAKDNKLITTTEKNEKIHNLFEKIAKKVFNSKQEAQETSSYGNASNKSHFNVPQLLRSSFFRHFTFGNTAEALRNIKTQILNELGEENSITTATTTAQRLAEIVEKKAPAFQMRPEQLTRILFQGIFSQNTKNTLHDTYGITRQNVLDILNENEEEETPGCSLM